MGIFSAHNDKEKLILVFDIGSSSVGGALFFLGDGGGPEIVYSIRESIILEANINVDRFLTLTLKALESITSKICIAGVGSPGKIFCVLSSPWYVSQTRVIKMEKNTSFVFTDKLADSLIQKEISLFEEEYLNKYSNVGSPVRSIEFKNIKTLLNGYETVKPLNQKAKELEMTILISISEMEILTKFEETIFRHFHSKEIFFCSFALASFAVVRDLYPESNSFLLMDIGGEVTDISMIKKNVLHGSISFPLGRNFIIRGIASSLETSLGEAKSSLSLYKDGHGELVLNKELGEVIEKLKVAWRQKFQECLVNISNDISIPSNIYIAVDEDLAEFFIEAIESEQFNQYTLTESKFKISFLGSEALHGLAQFKDNIDRDPFLTISVVYINRFLTKI